MAFKFIYGCPLVPQPTWQTLTVDLISVHPHRVHRHATEDNLGSSSARHKIVVMGATKVGKSSLITQFLYSRFSPKYKRTIEEMHQGNFNVAGVGLTLDILDTSGSNEVIQSINRVIDEKPPVTWQESICDYLLLILKYSCNVC